MLLERQSRRHGAMPMTILPNLAQENEALKQKLADMQAMLAQASKPRAITMKVGEKGGLSVYGMGQWPVTLYRGQWERLLAHAPAIHAFIEANAHLLAV